MGGIEEVEHPRRVSRAAVEVHQQTETGEEQLLLLRSSKRRWAAWNIDCLAWSSAL